jgi:two-component system OmpR family sensor kinase
VTRFSVWLPALLGLLSALTVWALWDKPPHFYADTDLGAVLLLAGTLLTLAGVVIVFFRRQLQYVRNTSVEQANLRTVTERRLFMRRLDHELKNPLTAILAALGSLGPIAQEDPVDEEAFGILQDQVQRLQRLTEELRKLAELETASLDQAPVELNGILKECLEAVHSLPEWEERHVSLMLPRAPWPLPSILGDRDLLFMAFYNLLENAMKFTNPGDAIEIRAYDDRNSVVVEIADTGPGIDAHEQPYVWSELYRGFTARGRPGSGLGLALVKTVTERHGGQVGLESRPGQGTKVTVRFPRGD